MGHPAFDQFLASQISKSPCGEIMLSQPVLPYQYYLSHMTPEDVPLFIVNETKVRPQCAGQLAEALSKFPEYAKYAKTLVML